MRLNSPNREHFLGNPMATFQGGDMRGGASKTGPAQCETAGRVVSDTYPMDSE